MRQKRNPVTAGTVHGIGKETSDTLASCNKSTLHEYQSQGGSCSGSEIKGHGIYILRPIDYGCYAIFAGCAMPDTASRSNTLSRNKSFHPDTEKEIYQHGFIKRIWVEIFDAEIKDFLLSPIDELKCPSCPWRPQEVLNGER
jgi:hypothetical protein